MNHQPSPELFLSTVGAYQRTSAIKGAIELEVFTAIAEGATTPKTLSRRCQASERGIRILSDYLVSLGFLTKIDGEYGLTTDSAVFLDRRSPAYMGGTIDFMLHPMQLEGKDNVAGAVRRGGTMLRADGCVSRENPVWVPFAQAMIPMMAPLAKRMVNIVSVDQNRKVKLLDVAAGHGIFGIEFAKANPGLEVTALDWAPVLKVAKENAKKFGVAGRHHLLAGSAFDIDLGAGYDLILLTNFLHHFDTSAIEGLLKKAGKALTQDGQIVTLEFIPDEDRVTPPAAAAFAMTMMLSTAGGDAYTFAEYEQMFINAGFVKNELHEVSPAHRVIISKR